MEDDISSYAQIDLLSNSKPAVEDMHISQEFYEMKA